MRGVIFGDPCPGERRVHLIVERKVAELCIKEVGHVGDARLDAIGLGIQHAGVYADRTVVSPGVSKGVTSHGSIRHSYESAVESEGGQQILRDGILIGVAESITDNQTEQANAYVGICAQRFCIGFGLPGLEIDHQRLMVRHIVRDLQRQSASCMR